VDPLLAARMRVAIGLQQALLRHVGVDLGRRQLAVAENAAQVGPPVQQVGREAVAERVRARRSLPPYIPRL
jgi:hypothetical protein